MSLSNSLASGGAIFNQRLFCALLLLGLFAGLANADGTLTHLSGQVSILRTDGKTSPAVVGTKAMVGDTVITGPGAYVRLEMSDGSELVLRPDSHLKIEAYRFNEAKPAEDSSVFNMLKGGLRTVTGLISKRGNKEAYELKTPTATIGIRGTQFDIRVCDGNCGALADGTYLAVRFGAVQAANAQGVLPVLAGQVAHVPRTQAPIVLPRDPGVGFTPPASIPKLDEKKKLSAEGAPAAKVGPPTTEPTPKPPTNTPPGNARGAENSGRGDSAKPAPPASPASPTGDPSGTPSDAGSCAVI